MPYHIWGDDFDWNALNQACHYVEKRCRQFARFGVWTKEKYGTMRVSTTCAYISEYGFLEHFFYPGYVRYMWPMWFRKYIDRPIGRLMRKIGVIRLLNKYQTFVLKYFWKRAAKKWPQVAEEILDEFYWTFDLKEPKK